MSTTQFTVKDACQYVRLTLKQYGFSHLTVEWVDESTKSFLGLACIQQNKIKLNKRILGNFNCFRETLVHEIVHFEQVRRNGGQFKKKNGRWSFHGSDFKSICAEFGIPARTRIPL